MPIQLASEANVAEHLVIEAEGSDSGVSEERKKEAEKPLYIKRM
jgi:hypothetical protein